MIAAHAPVQRPPAAKLLVVDAEGGIRHALRAMLADYLRPGDLLVANDAATLPASLRGTHLPTGAEIEVRIAGRGSLAPDDIHDLTVVLFGAGDHRTPTEHRPPPPQVRPGDRLALGPLRAIVVLRLGHPRLLALRLSGTTDEIWAGIAQHGRPIQYAHIAQPLSLWDVWTPMASVPAAFEPPSAGFLLDWHQLAALRRRGIEIATLTHAAGLSSTGDPTLDQRLPLDEPYRIPASTARGIARTKAMGGRVVALGTTVTRALEHAATRGGTLAGDDVATQRLGPRSQPTVVDALISGVHAPGESHYELLRAFASDTTLKRVTRVLEGHGYRSHEFGDSVLVEKQRPAHERWSHERWSSVGGKVPALIEQRGPARIAATPFEIS